MRSKSLESKISKRVKIERKTKLGEFNNPQAFELKYGARF